METKTLALNLCKEKLQECLSLLDQVLEKSDPSTSVHIDLGGGQVPPPPPGGGGSK